MNNPPLLEALINELRHSPAEYLGKCSIDRLHAFLQGWLVAHEFQVPDVVLLQSFQDAIQKKYRISATVTWADIITLHSTDDREAFEKFFLLFDEHLKNLK